MTGWSATDREDFERRVRAVDWSPFWTAYGHAHKQSSYGSIPNLLVQLSSDDEQQLFRASGALWASLCHQDIRSSPAAVAAMPFFLEAFDRSSDSLRYELLALFKGFAVTSERHPNDAWSPQLIQALRDARHRFAPLANSPNEDIRHFISEIMRVTA